MHHPSLLLFWSSMALLIPGTLLWFGTKERLGKVILFLSAALMALGYAFLCDFLWPWDERFHALVAKNLLGHPLTPMLYDQTPYSGFAHDFWNKGHVWLHKQPFFTWLMAISIKAFGNTSWSPRIPAAILLALASLASQRIGALTLGKRAGYVSFLVVAFSPYLLGLVSGEISLDQNDSIFTSLVIFSLWGWVEWTQNGTKKWLLLTGLFAGLAILTKWLPGLLVFGGWGLFWLTQQKANAASLKSLLGAFLVAVIVALPWQAYTFWAFPDLAQAEWIYNSTHLWEPVEGHGGPWWFHLEMAYHHLGPVFIGLLAFGLWTTRKNALFVAMAGMLLWVQIFYAGVATKMNSFTLVGFLPAVWFISAGADRILGLTQRWPILSNRILPLAFALTLLLAWTQPIRRFEKTRPENPSHVPYHGFHQNKLHFEKWNDLPTGIIFNMRSNTAIDCMYYTDHVAYKGYPKASALAELQALGVPIYLCTYPGEAPPSYLVDLPWIIWIEGAPYNYG